MALTDKLSAIGDAIREKTGGTELITLDNMPAEILAIQSGGGDDVEPIVLTGVSSYACAGKLSGKYIEKYGNTISTEKVTDTNHMFYKNTGVYKVPFAINVDNSTYREMSYMFQDSSLEELPVINNARPGGMSSMFQGMTRLSEIPEGWTSTWNWDRMHTYRSASMGGAVYMLYSLRKIAPDFLKNFWGIQTSASYTPYYRGFANCYVLDEINGIAVHQATLTSNIMTQFCGSLFRAKNATFETNEDGTPKTANWKNQTWDLYSYPIGYSTNRGYMLNYSQWHGITTDKEVTDDASYQALKNDPDWWTSNIKYSRYNHDSAVRTINSLPDCSASGGVNTIKFRNGLGEFTDGGAVDTLTEEEIAVATAKGWTITFA